MFLDALPAGVGIEFPVEEDASNSGRRTKQTEW